MKKLLILVAVILGVSTVSAQKFARINSNDIVMAMPEVTEIEKNLQTLAKDWQEQLEQIQVEFNNKALEFEKSQATLSASMKQMKQKELQDLQQRFAENQQMAQQEMDKKQQELFEPVHKKVQDAIDKVAKAGGYIAVFNTMVPSFVYIDEAQVVDIAPLVRKELGLAATPATPATPNKK
jgi:outer membrane protein